MSLTTRLLVFTQAVLTVVLLIFCVALYVAASVYLHYQVKEGVERAVDTLVASVDIEPDSVEWEPTDRHLSLESAPLGGAMYWYITDACGRPVDRSPASGTADLIAATGTDIHASSVAGSWRLARRQVQPPGATGAQLVRDRTAEEIEKGEYPALIFTVGARTEPIHSALSTLALGLGGVSLLVWFVTLAVGRRICRRALKPVTEMAAAARVMKAEDANSRLPPAGVRGELEELHAAISGLLDRLREALGREKRFTAEASHQLRTPLGTILGQADVTLRRPRSSEEYERVLTVIRRQAGQLSQAVESLLFLARSEADAQPPTLEVFDLADWVAEYTRSLADNPRAADLTFEPESGQPFFVAAHPQLLRELVQNLVDNAFKYSPPGSPVCIHVARSEGAVVLTVADRGSGIPISDVPYLFEPFYRSAEARRRGIPGAGLGLAVVARIAAAFGAHVGVTSPPAGGAQFAVSFPAASRAPKE